MDLAIGNLGDSTALQGSGSSADEDGGGNDRVTHCDGVVVVLVEELELVVEGKRIKRVSSLCAGLLSKEWNDRSRAKQQLARGLKYAKTRNGA